MTAIPTEEDVRTDKPAATVHILALQRTAADSSPNALSVSVTRLLKSLRFVVTVSIDLLYANQRRTDRESPPSVLHTLVYAWLIIPATQATDVDCTG